MSQSPDMHLSRAGYVLPTEKAEDEIYENFWIDAASLIPDDIEDETMQVTDEVVNTAFEAGWFHDEMSEEKMSVLIQRARDKISVEVPYDPDVQKYFMIMAKRSMQVGSKACRDAYVKLMNGDNE